MKVPIEILFVLMFLSATLVAQETRSTQQATASVTIVSINDLSEEELVHAKAQLTESRYIRIVDKVLSAKGYRYPANTTFNQTGAYNKFTFTELVTTDNPSEILSFTQKINKSNIPGLVDISISPQDHQCELTVEQNINEAILLQLFQSLGFNGYTIATETK